MKHTFTNPTLILTICFLWTVGDSLAQNALLHVPLSGNNGKPIPRVITVAKQHGDFTDPIEALASITDANEGNAYVVLIGPGVFNLSSQLQVMPHVDVVGSGKGVTVLSGSVSGSDLNNSNALIFIRDETRIANLSINNTGSSQSYCFGIWSGVLADSESTQIEDVDISVSGCNQVAGLQFSSSKSRLSHISINVNGQTFGLGIDSSLSQLSIFESTINANSVTGSTGVRNFNSSAQIFDSRISALSGSPTGVLNTSNASFIRLFNSVVNAELSDKGVPISVSASTGSGENESYIANSILQGSVFGTPKCNFTYLSNGNPLDSSCSAP